MAKDKFATSELNFTYYLGAGASAEALPIINNISLAFLSLSQSLETNPNIEQKYNDIRAFYVKQLKEMAEQSQKFGTIDTYIKFLFLKDKNKFNEVKYALSFFFYYQQAFIKNRDKRALIFLTTVIQHSIVFPTNINLISWNYDFQIELTAELFTQEELSSHSSIVHHKPPLISYFPSPSPLPHDYVQLIHLNGIAGMYKNEKANRYSYFFHQPESINELFKIFLDEYSESLISFAWEHENSIGKPFQDNKLNFASAIMEQTDTLIIIGYSFPYFNRLVDKLMFQKFLANDKNKKIYFQNPVLDGSFLKNQFDIRDDIPILHIKEKENYYIPKEL